MSRRTKVITLALFLVLLAIPALYVAYTWYPACPLRMRLESVDSQSAERYGPFKRALCVRVENTGSVPVYFGAALMEANFGPDTFPGALCGMLSCQEYSACRYGLDFIGSDFTLRRHGVGKDVGFHNTLASRRPTRLFQPHGISGTKRPVSHQVSAYGTLAPDPWAVALSQSHNCIFCLRSRI